MNHPTREEWMSYLYDELPSPRRTDLQAHLGVCPDCKRSVEGWRRTLAHLDAWDATPPRRKPAVLPLVVRWAAAAGLVLGVGFLVGRASAPAVDTAQLRTELRQEFASQLQKSMDASRGETREALGTLARAWTEARREDQQSTLSMLQRAEQNRQADFASLRRDLETVAVVGEQGLLNTRNQLARLTIPSQPGGTDPDIIPASLNPAK
jgi:hypothetical protein